MVEPFASLLADAREDPRVLGVILGGSRGKGLGTATSDWDVYIVVANDALPDEVRADVCASADERVDLCGVLTLDDFASHAQVGDSQEWNSYNFAHLTPSLDRTDGLLQHLCDEKERLPEDLAHMRARSYLDAYVNSYYRSLKNARDGNTFASRLDAAESVPWLLGLVFTAERRARPYNKYLAWELEKHPVSSDWWGLPDPAAAFLNITASGDIRLQAAMFRGVERRARCLDLGDVLDAWGSWSLSAMTQGSVGG